MSSFTDAPTGLQICQDKLQFLLDALSQPKVEIFELSAEGTSGLFFVLQEIHADMERAGRMAKGGM